MKNWAASLYRIEEGEVLRWWSTHHCHRYLPPLCRCRVDRGRPVLPDRRCGEGPEPFDPLRDTPPISRWLYPGIRSESPLKDHDGICILLYRDNHQRDHGGFGWLVAVDMIHL